MNLITGWQQYNVKKVAELVTKRSALDRSSTKSTRTTTWTHAASAETTAVLESVWRGIGR
jgi:hypothetical protein